MIDSQSVKTTESGWSTQVADNDDIGDGMNAVFSQEWRIAESCLRRDIGRDHWLASPESVPFGRIVRRL